MTRPFRCADAGRERQDPLVGSVAPMSRWLLIEYAGPWAVLALESDRLRGEAGRLLHEAAAAVRGRVLLIRRPGRRRTAPTQAWCVLDPALGQQWGTWREPSDLREAAEVMKAGPDESISDRPAPGSAVLVCTHGRHDACCAIRGRPVAAALSERWPDQVWECSHVGGDRFAPNVLVLPDGTCYGRLDPDDAVAVVGDHLEGRVGVEHLRGSSLVSPPAQAALAEAQRRFGPAAPGAFTVVSSVEIEPGVTEVTITGGSSVLVASVQRGLEPAARRTCRAQRDLTAVTYSVTSLRSR